MGNLFTFARLKGFVAKDCKPLEDVPEFKEPVNPSRSMLLSQVTHTKALAFARQRINVWPAKDLVVVFTGGEFEPGDLAKFILHAIRSDRSLSANPESVAKLKRPLIESSKHPS